MIKLCQRHFLSLIDEWGGINEIKEAYGSYLVVQPPECETLECIKRYHPELLKGIFSVPEMEG